MSEIEDAVRDKMRRTISHEFARMEDDFDVTRHHRSQLMSKLMEVTSNLTLVDDAGNPKEDSEASLKIINTALKTLESTEKANAQAIMLKMKQTEQEIASSAAAKDRIAIILRATAPGKIMETFPAEELEATLAEMFDGTIQDFELKSSPRDLETD